MKLLALQTSLQNQASRIILALFLGFTVPSVYAYSFADACPGKYNETAITTRDKSGKTVSCLYNNQGYLAEASYYNSIQRADITYCFYFGTRKVSRRRADYDNLGGYQKIDFTPDGELSSIQSNIKGLMMSCYRTNPGANYNQFTCSYDDIVGVQFKFNAHINNIITSD